MINSVFLIGLIDYQHPLLGFFCRVNIGMILFYQAIVGSFNISVGEECLFTPKTSHHCALTWFKLLSRSRPIFCCQTRMRLLTSLVIKYLLFSLKITGEQASIDWINFLVAKSHSCTVPFALPTAIVLLSPLAAIEFIRL